MIKMKKSKKPSKLVQSIIDEVAPDSKGVDSDDDEVTRAKIVGDEDDLDNDDTWNLNFESERSDLRTKNAKILADFDSRYKGKKTSRKALMEDRDEALAEKDHGSAELGFMFEGGSDDDDEQSDEEDGEEEEEDDSEEEGSEVEEFENDEVEEENGEEKDGFRFEKGSGIDYGAFGGDSDEDDQDDDGDDDNDDDDNDQSEQDDEDQEDNDDGGTRILKNDVQSEVDKGVAIKQQLSEWDSLFECRIQLQKVLTKINQYPNYENWSQFANLSVEGEETNTRAIKKAQTSLANLLDALLELRVTMVNKNEEVKEALKATKRVHSDEDEELAENEDQFKAPSKKLKLREYENLLSQDHANFKTFRDKTIEKWNDKTRLATGHLKAKSFAGFESSTLQQIEHILADKSRLIRRTQLKRSAYSSLGENLSSDGDNKDDYNAEIFDDDDFYHQLLRELIERKSEDITDPSQLGQQWLQIQKMRSKMKKKVDTKASKGRKTRFDIHSKLVNFMAPVYCESLLTDEARTELYKSLFGKSSKEGK